MREKYVTNRVNQSEVFGGLIEIDVMDFQNCVCKCSNSHTCMCVNDEHAKFISVYPLLANKAAEVLAALKVHCNTHGYPKEILYDSGKDCHNLRMKLCKILCKRMT